MSEHVIRRGARYYYRRRVPIELVEKLDGKREVQRALGTSDLREARILARRVGVEVDELFERARTGAVAPPKPRPNVDPAPWSSRAEEEAYPPHESELAVPTEQDKLIAEQRSALNAFKEDLSIILASARQRVLHGAHAIPSIPTHTQATGTPGAGLNEAFAAWERIRQPTQETKATMLRVIQRFREVKGPAKLADIQRTHLTALLNSLQTSSLATQRTYLSMFKALLSAAVSAELISHCVAANYRVEGKEKGKARIPFAVSDVQCILDSLPASGAARWIPLLALYTGARREEIGQLRREDIKHETYRDASGKTHKVHMLYITDDDDTQRLKNTNSRRRVPVHAELIRMGFMDHVSKQTGPIFPELVPDRTGRVTSAFGKAFSKSLRTKYGVTDTRKTFHSFRHLFKEVLREHGVPKAVNDALTGHSSGDTAEDYGGEFYPVRPLVEAMEKYEIHGLELASQK
ncbi:site-specific integrase [Paraburkholderia kirstenboschensis]|uniref:Site-specific integrase n=1 Tax=Paraburkholderia kirstenboschensis TaxID=1245436 RepID=A0ABZ0EI28_9BURK|nr:site-specific integrase [Paraburkholderia kirstenboschensis]WOD15947.1 site-specific integrase [Paraburkholderia kirstenboschensis]